MMKKWLALFAVFAVSSPMAAQAALIETFEAPTVATNGYVYNPTSTTSTFSSNSGIINGISAFGNPAPMGSQLGFLQRSNGIAGTITETVTTAFAGLYTISLLDASRASSPQSSFTIMVDGNVIGGDAPITGSTLTAYNSNSFLLTTTGVHTIVFTAAGSSVGTDTTTFLDNISFNAVVPEPSSIVMLGLGLVVSGGAFAKKVRRNRASA